MTTMNEGKSKTLPASCKSPMDTAVVQSSQRNKLLNLIKGGRYANQLNIAKPNLVVLSRMICAVTLLEQI